MALDQGAPRTRRVEWDRFEWSGGAVPAAEAALLDEDRWNKFEWRGDQGRSGSRGWRSAAEMPEGEVGLSGFRHNPGVQHWAGTRP